MLKELGAKWLEQMAKYFAENPKIIVNGFVKAGITAALDGLDEERPESEAGTDSDSESDFDVVDN